MEGSFYFPFHWIPRDHHEEVDGLGPQELSHTGYVWSAMAVTYRRAVSTPPQNVTPRRIVDVNEPLGYVGGYGHGRQVIPLLRHNLTSPPLSVGITTGCVLGAPVRSKPDLVSPESCVKPSTPKLMVRWTSIYTNLFFTLVVGAVASGLHQSFFYVV